MSEWEDRRLGDCVQMLSGGTPSKAKADYWNGHIPWVSAKDLKSFFLHDTQDHITQEAAQNGTKIAPENSILILVRGMTLHNDLPIGCPTREMAFNQDVKAIIADKNLIESKYLAYWLLANKLQLMGLVESASHGTGRINTDDLKSVIISYPDLKEQKQISGLLENFDRKIENLRRQNETLEAITQTLFKHWFVDFEFPNEDRKPYKSFGGEMEQSELGEIPVGWRVGKLGDEVETLGGGTPSTTTSEYWEKGNIPWYSPTDLTKSKSLFSLGSEKMITKLGLQKSSARLFSKYSLLLTSRATIGEITINTQDACTNQGFITLIPNKTFSVYFLYSWLLTQVNLIKQLASGSTFPELSKSTFRNFSFLIPDPWLLAEYNQVIKPIFQKIENNIEQIQSLTKTRDVLLPKLMSGQLRIVK